LQRVLTTVTLLGLLVATAAAFAITEHLKLMKSEILGIQIPTKVFSPVCHCATGAAVVSLKLRRADHVTVTIVDASGHAVRTIASGVFVQARLPTQFEWDGRTDAGGLAPDGVYHPWVHLPRKTFPFATNIILDTQAPRVLSASVAKPVLLGGPGRSVAIHYAFSEPAHAVVYLGGRRIIVGRRTQPHNKVKWAGTRGGLSLRVGTYALSVGAQDLAGNETPAGARKQVTVTVRYVELSPGRLTLPSGRRFAVHVATGTKRYTWRLGLRHGAGRGKLLRLRAPTTPGTYRLVVQANGHAGTAVVRVRGK